MGLLDKINKKLKIRFFNKIDRAIDQVKFGLYSRLNKEIQKKNDPEPGLLAAAIVNELFSLSPTTDEAREFFDKNRKKVGNYIDELKNDDELKWILTQVMNVRLQVVVSSVGSGSSDEFARTPLNNLQKKGFILEHEKIIEPGEFIKFAKKYFKESPEY